MLRTTVKLDQARGRHLVRLIELASHAVPAAEAHSFLGLVDRRDVEGDAARLKHLVEGRTTRRGEGKPRAAVTGQACQGNGHLGVISIQNAGHKAAQVIQHACDAWTTRTLRAHATCAWRRLRLIPPERADLIRRATRHALRPHHARCRVGREAARQRGGVERGCHEGRGAKPGARREVERVGRGRGGPGGVARDVERRVLKA